MRSRALLAVGWALAALFPAAAAAQTDDPRDPPAPYTGPPILTSPGTPSPWLKLRHKPAVAPGSMLLLTDGRVLVHEDGSPRWDALVPDAHGSYRRGSWHRMASLPENYSPFYFASAVLPDGRVIVLGGEYDGDGPMVESNRGAIYDPRANRWRFVDPPPGWDSIGDTQSTLLADGRLLVADISSGADALLDPRTLTWTPTGTGKVDGNNEEGFALLPDGRVLTVDSDNRGSELYDPATGAWSSAGTIPVELVDAGREQGPLVSGPDGTVFAVGATGHTAIYHSVFAGQGHWTQGPDLPEFFGDQYGGADAAAARLPNGKVLLDASPGQNAPTHVFIFDGHGLSLQPDGPHWATTSAFESRMLVLPTGDIFYDDGASAYLFHPGGRPRDSWRPRIGSVPHTLVRGGTYSLSGAQLAGRDQGASYGDDFQDNTNYPLVRLVRAKPKHVSYARTFDWTSVSTAPGARSTTKFTVPRNAALGKSTVVVVANGIASKPVRVKVTAR